MISLHGFEGNWLQQLHCLDWEISRTIRFRRFDGLVVETSKRIIILCYRIQWLQQKITSYNTCLHLRCQISVTNGVFSTPHGPLILIKLMSICNLTPLISVCWQQLLDVMLWSVGHLPEYLAYVKFDMRKCLIGGSSPSGQLMERWIVFMRTTGIDHVVNEWRWKAIWPICNTIQNNATLQLSILQVWWIKVISLLSKHVLRTLSRYVLHEHEGFDQYGPYVMPFKLMQCYCYIASLMNQNDILHELSY